ncbi:MAG: MFS transporter [Gluconacetobacter diazotrophicus]|nr:MFS transporter [Gluconacetobacter diazotrophicus]
MAAAIERHGLLERIGLPRPLFWGFVGTLLFMVGDGVESAYLSPFLVHRGLSEHAVAILVTVYGIAAAVSSWLSGALSDLIGPRRVMLLGLLIWIVFQVLFLTLAIPSTSYGLMLLFYGLRGFGYPLFAFGFLVWIVLTVQPSRLGSAVGWFWFAFTGGLPTLGSAFARGAIPLVGTYATLWLALVLVVGGGLVAIWGIQDREGGKKPAGGSATPFRTLLHSFDIVRTHPKVGLGCLVRAVNTSAEFGFLVMLPIYFTQTLHFTLAQWLEVTTCIFASNIVGNLLSGVVSDRLTWRRTIMLVGGVGCTITTLLLYYVPTTYGPDGMGLTLVAGALYGLTLAGYVPLSALMPYLAPEDKPAAMSMLNLGAGASVWIGPAIVALFQGSVGVLGVMCIYAAIYLSSAVMAYFLVLDPAVEAQVEADRAAGTLVGGH